MNKMVLIKIIPVIKKFLSLSLRDDGEGALLAMRMALKVGYLKPFSSLSQLTIKL
jgi:hypothetical protein